MAGDRDDATRRSILRFEPGPPGAGSPAARIVVLDTTWTATADADPDIVGVRTIADRILAERDLIAETSGHLDAWATASGVIPTLSIQGGSMWFYDRLREWLWLQTQILWLRIVDDLVQSRPTTGIECAAGSDPELVAAARMIAARDGLPFRVESDLPDGPDASPDGSRAVSAARSPDAIKPTAVERPTPSRWARVASRLLARGRPDQRSMRREEIARRREAIAQRLALLAGEPGRLLAVLAHAHQRVETPSGPRSMNVYLGPILDHLRGGRLDPMTIELGWRIDSDQDWARLQAPGSERFLPADVVWSTPVPSAIVEEASVQAEQVATRILADARPMTICGVDLGPVLADRIADQARRTFAGRVQRIERIRGLFRQLRPAVVLLADEYHRQEWLTAAKLEHIPTVAVQHGLIYRWHNGYAHRDRPLELRLPERTYVFGQWERDLLTSVSVYRDDEVRVSGSPRLDLVSPETVDRGLVRAELGVADGDRLVVVSGTWGPIYRRFYYPAALERLFDRPMPNVHLVIKLHPGETDEGPYRQVIEGVAAARGFEPPPITVVQSIDLFRLLKAADAHIGVHSTVLTEAVMAGTPNLLADTVAGSDLLGYVEAAVATPIRDGADLLAALDRIPDEETAAAARQAFLDAHFRPGPAASRIAADLLAWPA